MEPGLQEVGIPDLTCTKSRWTDGCVGVCARVIEALLMSSTGLCEHKQKK
jgi:hypothetical protein